MACVVVASIVDICHYWLAVRRYMGWRIGPSFPYEDIDGHIYLTESITREHKAALFLDIF